MVLEMLQNIGTVTENIAYRPRVSRMNFHFMPNISILSEVGGGLKALENTPATTRGFLDFPVPMTPHALWFRGCLDKQS